MVSVQLRTLRFDAVEFPGSGTTAGDRYIPEAGYAAMKTLYVTDIALILFLIKVNYSP